MLVASLQTDHVRAVPILWKTVVRTEMKGLCDAYEDEVMVTLRELIPQSVSAVIVADRGFGEQKFLRWLAETLGFGYVIRFKADTFVTIDDGESRPAGEWFGKGVRLRTLRNVRLTTDETPSPTVVVVKEKNMDDTWCLACTETTWAGAIIKRIYGKRFKCEETFRDIKDLRFGMGMKWTRISKPERRDRLMFLAVLGQALLTLLGAAGEAAGLDRFLKANTAKKRTLFLLRQGLRWYELVPTMPGRGLRVLMEAFEEKTRADATFCGLPPGLERA